MICNKCGNEFTGEKCPHCEISNSNNFSDNYKKYDYFTSSNISDRKSFKEHANDKQNTNNASNQAESQNSKAPKYMLYCPQCGNVLNGQYYCGQCGYNGVDEPDNKEYKQPDYNNQYNQSYNQNTASGYYNQNGYGYNKPPVDDGVRKSKRASWIALLIAVIITAFIVFFTVVIPMIFMNELIFSNNAPLNPGNVWEDIYGGNNDFDDWLDKYGDKNDDIYDGNSSEDFQVWFADNFDGDIQEFNKWFQQSFEGDVDSFKEWFAQSFANDIDRFEDWFEASIENGADSFYNWFGNGDNKDDKPSTPSDPNSQTKPETDKNAKWQSDTTQETYLGGISKEEYVQIEKEMTYFQVSAIIGGDGSISNKDAESFIANWIVETNPDCYISIYFKDGKVETISELISMNTESTNP